MSLGGSPIRGQKRRHDNASRPDSLSKVDFP